MVQVQNGRLHFNWLGDGGEIYPRYEAIRDGLRWALSKFDHFARDEGLGSLQPNQWEITYVNHVGKGTVWNDPQDWSFFLPLNPISRIPESLPLQSFGGEWHFESPPKQGRLHVEWRHGKQPDPKKSEDIVLTLTARGPASVDGSEALSVFDGLDLGRDAIVRSFKNLMSDSANQYWGLSNA
jgi:hypothetical protein